MPKFLLICFLFCLAQFSRAQRVVSGKVMDLETNEGVAFCKVFFIDGQKSTSTDFEGNFKIVAPENAYQMAFSFFGYDTTFVSITSDSLQPLIVELKPKRNEVKKVLITGNTENPAHRIMRNLVSAKSKNDGYLLDAFQHESYSKIEIDVDKMSDKFQERKAVAKIISALDSNNRLKSEKGTLILPVFFSETHSQYFYNHNPEQYRENILRTKISGLGITDGTFTSQLIGSYFQTYNIYNNWLNIAGRDFISPVTDLWKNYYDYELEEFIENVNGKFCYRIRFTPKRAQDLAFSGTLWITHDEYALKQIDVRVGKSANLNFIEKVNITQEFEQVQDSGAWLPNKTRIVLDVEQLGKNPGLIAKSYVSNYDYKINLIKPPAFFDTKIVLDENALDTDPKYWEINRADSLTVEELRIYGMIDTIKNLPVVKNYTEIVDLVISGYKTIGQLDVGPPLNLYAYNNLEGHRFSLGAKTNYKMSKKFYLKGALSYGTLDKTFKYNLKSEFKLVKKNHTILGLETYKDIEQMGVYSAFNQNNYLFNAFNRWGTLRQAFMLNDNNIYLNTDLLKGVRQMIELSQKQYNPLLPFRYFTEPGQNTAMDSQINITTLTIGYRFGFKESYLSNDFDRITVGMPGKPVFKIYGIFGFSNFLGGNFEYQKFYSEIKHNFRLGILGRVNYAVKLGFTPDILPYPLLENHLGNRTFFYNNASFNMMRIFEFASDRFASLSIYHDFDGFISNRIPLFRRLKWRFFLTSNVLIGSIKNANLALIPAQDENGRPIQQFNGLTTNKPYAEFGYGINNIFKIVRVDFLHRVNYLNTGAPPFGVKVSVQFSL